MRRVWSDEEVSRLRALYPTQPTNKLAKIFGRSVLSVYQEAYRYGLRKTKEFLRSPDAGILVKGQTLPEGIPHQFKKGQTPANKGLRRPGWSPGRMRETQFRKGQRTGKAAENWKAIGTIVTDTEGYQRIKVREAVHGAEATGFGNPAVWPFLQRHVWEQRKGPIPPGHVVAFIDKNRQNCAIENLECIPRSELARRNGMWTIYPRDLAEVIQLNGQLKRKLRKQA